MGRDGVLLFDQVLLRQKAARKFILSFKRRVPLVGGEKSKSIENFPAVIKTVSEKAKVLAKSQTKIVCLGGGSIGDLGGFVASVFKRGVSLIHIPSTWLAALDSAHGGKNALNIGSLKNQVGTIYPAQTVYLVKELLESNKQKLFEQSCGEFIKMALIEGGAVWSAVKSKQLNSKMGWQLLPSLIEAKYKIVYKDPFERTGHRYLLNLGHTLGHALEVENKLPHGQAVALGLRVAIDFSIQQKFLREGFLDHPDIPSKLQVAQALKVAKNWQASLHADKKRDSTNSINFVFIKSPGNVLVQKIQLKDLINFCKRTYL